MNVIHPTAANGIARRTFTTDDIRRMVDSGVIRENERLELIDGDLIMMAAKSLGHDRLKSRIAMAMSRAASDDLIVGVENTLQFAENVLVEPDIAVVSRAIYEGEAKGFARPNSGDVLLVVEVAISSLDYDRDVKVSLYARHGVREYWLVDGEKRTTWVHTGPSDDGWTSIVERPPHEALTTPALPNFRIRLADLG